MQLGASLGAAVTMLLGRFVLKDWVSKKAEKYPTLGAINLAIKSEGLKLIFLLRLCPLIPFNLLNYMMGITPISVLHYNIGSIGMIPGTMVYVFIGTTISDIATMATHKSKSGQMLSLVLIIVGTILACGGIVWVSIVAKQKLKEITERAENE